MKPLAITLLFTLFLFGVHSQWTPTGNLTVFSEDGAKFFLFLNGEQYNDSAETNVRIEELTNPYYSCKIVFENQNIPVISKNYMQVADHNGTMQDVTYRLRTNRKGAYTISPFSAIPAQQNMIRPSNCAVYQYGRPHQPMIGSNGVIYYDPAAVNMNVNVPGMQLNVNIPNHGTVHPSHTYPPGYQTPNYQTPIYHAPPTQPQPNGYYDYNRCQFPMRASDFEMARKTVAANGFDETRLSTAQQIVSANCLSSDQILALMNTFSFEDTKLNFAKYAYSFCVDRGNYFKVVNSFSFESSKIDLNNYIQTVRF